MTPTRPLYPDRSAATRYAAHRGGGALWPENSLLAFRNAIALGADLLEFDVHLTADGDLAVIHDTTLERTTDGVGAVAAQTGAALRQRRLRAPDGTLTDERLPMLADVLGAVGASGTPLLVEIKSPRDGRYEGLEEKLLAALQAQGGAPRASIMALNPDVLKRVRTLAPGARTTLVVAHAQVERAGATAADTIEWARAAGAVDLGLQSTLVDARLVQTIHAAGLSIGAWTVNDEPSMRRLVDAGVDVVMTDRPDLAARVLGR